MNVCIYFLRAWVGEAEYHEAWHDRERMWSFRLRFWGRLMLAAAGLGFFLWQQYIGNPQWWATDGFALFVLILTTSQAAGPCFYYLFRATRRIFFTQHYLETLQEGGFYLTMKSALGIVFMTGLSALAIYGLLGSHWYIKPLVFFLTVPVVCFWLAFPVLNWAGSRAAGLPKGGHEHKMDIKR